MTQTRGSFDIRPPEITPLGKGRVMRDFIRVVEDIYADDPCWVPPLRLERRLHFSGLNPYFKHARWQGWVAYREGRPVGRISAQIDTVHRERYGEHHGHFGLLESYDDPVIFASLLQTAENWLRSRGSTQISGPFNFSINQECGVLVDGFDTPPVVMMPHSRNWYGPRLEEQGYHRAMDLLAFWIDLDYKPSAAIEAVVRRYGGKISMRALRRDRFAEELEILRDIFNDAWSDNWGFLPLTREEFAELGNSLRLFIPDEYIQIAEIDGRPVSFIAVLPNLNEILMTLRGRLFPTGWWQILRAMGGTSVRTGRVPLMGVRKEFQNRPIGMALSYLICDEARKHASRAGMEGAEMSWILENNRGMLSILDNIGSREYKRYRIYEKSLAS